MYFLLFLSMYNTEVDIFCNLYAEVIEPARAHFSF